MNGRIPWILFLFETTETDNFRVVAPQNYSESSRVDLGGARQAEWQGTCCNDKEEAQKRAVDSNKIEGNYIANESRYGYNIEKGDER